MAVTVQSTSWNSVSLPDPEGYDTNLLYVGKTAVTGDGTARFDVNARYYEVALRWTNITRAQAEAIRTAATGMSATTLVLPTVTLTALPIRGTFRMATVGGASAAYDVRCSVQTNTAPEAGVTYWTLDAGYDLDDGLSLDTPI